MRGRITGDTRSFNYGANVHMSGGKETPETDDGEGFEDEDEDGGNKKSGGSPKLGVPLKEVIWDAWRYIGCTGLRGNLEGCPLWEFP